MSKLYTCFLEDQFRLNSENYRIICHVFEDEDDCWKFLLDSSLIEEYTKDQQQDFFYRNVDKFPKDFIEEDFPNRILHLNIAEYVE